MAKVKPRADEGCHALAFSGLFNQDEPEEKPGGELRNLWASVLRRAINDKLSGRAKVDDWFYSKEDSPGSFAWVLRVLDLERAQVMRAISEDTLIPERLGRCRFAR